MACQMCKCLMASNIKKTGEKSLSNCQTIGV